ncbi:MAG: transcription antitermination factor NusB [Gammaproteobacteria bacterium]|nr:transcription antitermination factor NusB [Gammaproteobacteria bacterium]MDH4256907.1 transcription antitermination factor NusB [Gammaproteobacteria bacterium]MDH5310510.1 transcription antitermination factor NusB [Gammaproteobacteria bacterium]
MSKAGSAGARSRARELVLQSLYQAQIAGHDKNELIRQFRERPEYERVDKEYFDELLPAICDGRDELEKRIAEFVDRPLAQLDPVEMAILLIGCYELESRIDVPYRAVINEAINLAKRFGAEDGHKYVNAVLDRAVRVLRPQEAVRN